MSFPNVFQPKIYSSQPLHSSMQDNALYEQVLQYSQSINQGILQNPCSQQIGEYNQDKILSDCQDYGVVEDYLASQCQVEDVNDLVFINSALMDTMLQCQLQELQPQISLPRPTDPFTVHSANAEVLQSATLSHMEVLADERHNLSFREQIQLCDELKPDDTFYQECENEVFGMMPVVENCYCIQEIQPKKVSHIDRQKLIKGINVLSKVIQQSLFPSLEKASICMIEGCLKRIQIYENYASNTIFQLLHQLDESNYIEAISSFDFNNTVIQVQGKFYAAQAKLFEPTDIQVLFELISENDEILGTAEMTHKNIERSFKMQSQYFSQEQVNKERELALQNHNLLVQDAKFEIDIYAQLVVFSMAYYVVRSKYVQDLQSNPLEPDLIDSVYNPHCMDFFTETDMDFCQDTYRRVFQEDFYSGLSHDKEIKVKKLDAIFDVMTPVNNSYLISNRGNIFRFNQLAQTYEPDISQQNHEQNNNQQLNMLLQQQRKMKEREAELQQKQEQEAQNREEFFIDTNKIVDETNSDEQITITIIPTSTTALSAFYHQKTTEFQRQNAKNAMKTIQLAKQKMLRRFRINKNSNCINAECTRFKKLVNDFDSIKRKILFEGKPMIKKRWVARPGSRNTKTDISQNSIVNQVISRRLEETEEHIKSITGNLIKEGGENIGNGLQIEIFPTPSSFQGVLKNYQKLGFSWLANMHSQNLSCLLCDQMGLGKTIQIIAYFLHLCEKENTFGPFLVICPNSLLNNWVAELKRFAPSLNVWPYWGSPQQRQQIRSGFQYLTQINNLLNNKQIDENAVQDNELFGYQQCPLHVVVTSYALAVVDIKHLQKIPWYSMVLDEGQMIKSSETKRWATIMQYQAQNKILLSGTPIQNTLTELWSLLHFVQPEVFSSKENFADWFSKDLEVAISGNLNNIRLTQDQIMRLQQILAPFVLRREKKDVAQQLGEKTEIEVFCDMSRRQKQLYQGIKSKINLSELFSSIKDDDQLRNIIMQLRKVVNHPQIFEKSLVYAPVVLSRNQLLIKEDEEDFDDDTKSQVTRTETNRSEVNSAAKVLSQVIVPQVKIVKPRQQLFDEMSEHVAFLMLRDGTRDVQLKRNVLFNQTPAFEFQFAGIVQDALIGMFSESEMLNNLCLRLTNEQVWESLSWLRSFGVDQNTVRTIIGLAASIARGESVRSNLSVDRKLLSYFRANQLLEFLFANAKTIAEKLNFGRQDEFFAPKVAFDFPPSASAVFQHAALGLPPAIFGRGCPRGRAWADYVLNAAHLKQLNPCSLQLKPFQRVASFSYLHFPGPQLLIEESGKLKALDKLLNSLHQQKQAVLIYSQMTKMMDILEDYLAYRRFGYVRLDGSTSVAERRQVVDKFMTDPNIFAFILSTRAGSLGLNLTRANNVIFYESDWNPTSDLQAQDRVHRIGQTKNVQVYKIICRNSIDERILKRAQEKNILQKLVMDGQQRDENGNLLSTKRRTAREEMMELLGQE